MTLVPLSKETHAGKRLAPLRSYAFAANTAVLPLYAAELARAATVFPIAFSREGEGESLRYFPVSVMSPEPGRNLYVAPDGRWIGAYIPAVLRRDPFVLARVEGREDSVVCVQSERDRLSDEEGEQLLTPEGEPTKLLNDISHFLTTLEQNRVVTERLCTALAEAELFQPWEMTVRIGENTRNITGLYRIDEARMNQLPDGAFLALRAAGALPAAYCHFLSTQHVQRLGDLAHAHARAQADAAARQQGPQNLDLDKAFGMEPDDELHFDF